MLAACTKPITERDPGWISMDQAVHWSGIENESASPNVSGKERPHQPSRAAKPLGTLLTWPTQMPITFNTDGTISDGCFTFVCKTRHSLRCSGLLRMTICVCFFFKKKANACLSGTHFLYAVRTEPGRMNSIPYFNPWGNLLQCHFNTDNANSLSK